MGESQESEEERVVTSGEQASSIANRNHQQLEDLFAIDFRSLVAFRILFAAILICKAVFGLAGYRNYLPSVDWTWSLWGLKVDIPALSPQGNLLFWSGLLCGGLLLLTGRWPRVAILWCWGLMVANVHGSLSGLGADIGSYLCVVALFWMLLLPKEAIASARKSTGKQRDSGAQCLFSTATAALLIQPVLVYFSAGITKHYQDWFITGDALFDLMHTQWATPFGRRLVSFPILLNVLTRVALFMEIAVPLLFLWPGTHLRSIRTVLVPVYILFHLAMGATIYLDFIPFICSAFVILFLPTSAWDRLLRQNAAREVHSQPDPSRIRNRIGGLCLVFVAVSFVLSLAQQIGGSPRAGELQAQYPKIGLFQAWFMFHSPSKLRALEEPQKPEFRPAEERTTDNYLL